MVGDLKYRRTVYSLTQALAKYKKTNFFYIKLNFEFLKLAS